MTSYLLDTGPLTGYLKGKQGAVFRIDPWIAGGEARTSLLVFGEVTEHLYSLPTGDILRAQLAKLLDAIEPLGLDRRIVERYADLRRRLRPPHGPGLIGDIDTLIAATAMEHGLTLVTTDTDFQRVPELELQLLPRKM